MESACRSMPPDAYLEASVAMAKGLEVSGRCWTGLVRKQFFSLLKAFWQEHSALVSEDSCVIGPVQKVGSELGGDFPFEGLKGVEYQGVLFRGSYDLLVEVSVDEVYK